MAPESDGKRARAITPQVIAGLGCRKGGFIVEDDYDAEYGGHLLERAVDVKRYVDNGSPVIEQLTYAHFVRSGELDRHFAECVDSIGLGAIRFRKLSCVTMRCGALSAASKTPGESSISSRPP